MSTLTDQKQIAEQLLRELVSDASAVLSDGKVTFGEIVHLGGSLASKANRFAQISGKDKQALVLQAVDIALKQVLALKEKTLAENEMIAFRKQVESAASFAKETLPAVLDVAVQAARGQLDFRKPEVRKTIWQTVKSLLRCCGVQAPSLPTPVEAFLEGPKEPEQSHQSLELSEKVATVPPTVESAPAEETRPANMVSA
jgi:hypothetical protein